MKSVLLIAFTLIASITSAVSFWLFYAMYLKWDFSESGQYFDPETQTVYSEAGFVWLITAAISLLIALLCIKHMRAHNKRRHNLQQRQTKKTI